MASSSLSRKRKIQLTNSGLFSILVYTQQCIQIYGFLQTYICINHIFILYDGFRYLQYHRDDSEKFPITSKLLPIFNLLPPSQSIVYALIVRKWCAFLPVKEVISDLRENRKAESIT